jgi:xanthine dehydrogenase accessory factor
VRDILSKITTWWEAGETFGLATVVRTFRSAPRDPGAALAVSPGGEVIGSVSGGCVEGAVYELSMDVSATGDPVLETYGVSDDDAFAVGLTCGGILDIFVEPVNQTVFPELGEIAAAVERGEPVAVATVIAGPGQIGARRVIWAKDSSASGTLGSGDRLDAAVDDDVRGMLAQGLTGIRRYGAHGERRGDELSVFVNSFAPAPRMLVFGAIDFAAAVARVGKFLGYHVTVCDARKVFATKSRFPEADEVVVEWPHRFLAGTSVDSRTVICVLTHDPKFDVPLLEVALRTPAGYIGAMGSRRTHEDRLGRLREVGLTDDELARLRSPIGLDLGARTPEETAVSIAAELIQLRWGGTGHPLTATEGRIHHQLKGMLPRRVRLDAVRTTVAGVLLAAGEGSRFGGPKALVELDGQTLAERGVGLLRAGGADPILVVTGAAQVNLPGTCTVYNPDWRTGMGSSLRAALNALAGPEDASTDHASTNARPEDASTDHASTDASPGTVDVGAVVVALADQPLVGPESVARLIAAYRAGASVAVAAYDGQPRNPVLLAREHWPEVIATATGDTGARAFLRARADIVTLIECGDTGRPDDIDTPADLARITDALTGH